MEAKNKLDFFKNFNFEPLFFLKTGSKIVSYLEFKEFIETIDFKEYFKHDFKLNHEDHLTTQTFFKLAYTYCVFFNEFYTNNEMFIKNKQWIKTNLELSYGRNFQKIYKINEEHDLSKKWFNIIEEFKNEEDNHQKNIILITLKSAFINEYIAFATQWLPEQIKKHNYPLVFNIDLVND